jgi:hypothetical protein
VLFFVPLIEVLLYREAEVGDAEAEGQKPGGDGANDGHPVGGPLRSHRRGSRPALQSISCQFHHRWLSQRHYRVTVISNTGELR